MNIEKTLRVKSVAGDTSFQQTTLLGVTLETPDSFGYSFEVNLNLNLGIAGVNGKAGLNYVVFTSGPYAWFPYEYAYAGYSYETIIKFNLKETIRSLKSLAKGKIKVPGLSINGGFSPFLAWMKEGTDDMYTPNSWEEWFSANTVNVQLKAGLGFSFGASVFASAPDGWEIGKVLSPQKGEWYGGTIDIGVGAGTPSVNIGINYASFYWLLDKPEIYSKSSFEYWNRWYNFLKMYPDIKPLMEKLFVRSGKDTNKFLSDVNLKGRNNIINEENNTIT
ncbi:MAG TPA: hypothetical protein VF677_02115 [Flavobacterium sp.]|jgi:hypothetical protein